MASPAVSSWPYSPTLGSHHAAKSPSLSDRNGSNGGSSSLHSALSNLTLSGGSANAQYAGRSPNYSNDDSQARRPVPLRTPSAGSLGKTVAAIGSGRSGNSPPSRSYLGPLDANSSNVQSNGVQGVQGVPWPTSSSASNGTQQEIRSPTQATSLSLQQQQQQQQDSQESRTENGQDSSSRFAMSQPQFNLDHAQLAKSREQRDLDDVDSGQRASATLWMGDLEGWMDESYIVSIFESFWAKQRVLRLMRTMFLSAPMHSCFRMGQRRDW